MTRFDERDALLIDKIANYIIDSGSDALIVPLLEGFEPMADVGGTLGYLGLFPFLEMLAIRWPNFHVFGDMLAKDPSGMSKMILKRVEELKVLRELEEPKLLSKQDYSLIYSRLKNFIKKIHSFVLGKNRKKE